MNDTHIKTLAQVHAFVEGTHAVAFSLPTKTERYGFIRRSLKGDLDGVKGLYHSNAVDEVTRFEVVGAVEKISERYLIPVLEQLLDQFPFVMKRLNGVRKLNNNSLKPLLNRTVRLHSGNPYSHYQNPEFSIIWLLEYTLCCCNGLVITMTSTNQDWPAPP